MRIVEEDLCWSYGLIEILNNEIYLASKKDESAEINSKRGKSKYLMLLFYITRNNQIINITKKRIFCNNCIQYRKIFIED